MQVVVEQRVDKLEDLLGRFITSTNKALMRMENGIMNLQSENKLLSETLKNEAERLDKKLAEQDKQFKEEMKFNNEQFRKEMKFNNEQFRKEMKAMDEQFRKETKAMDEQFRTDMKQFKMEMKAEADRMNKKWGDLANKMGTLVEDIVAPSIKRVAFELFGFKRIDFFGVRVEKTKVDDRGAQNEFDVIAVGEDKVILNETKSKPTSDYIKEFIDFLKNQEFYDYFPEFKEKKLIPIFSTLYMPADVVKRLTRKRIFAMGMSDSVMTVLNFDQCRFRGLKPDART